MSTPMFPDPPVIPTADLSLPDFIAWVSAKSADMIVGVCENPRHCPVAEWLLKVYGPPVSVGSFGFVAGPKSGRHPAWLRQLIAHIDAQTTPLTAGLVRSIAEEIQIGLELNL